MTAWHWKQIKRYRRFAGPPAIPNLTAYGVNTFEPPYGATAHATNITACQNIGATVIRCGLTWSNTQTTVGGAIDWTEWDSIYNKCVAAGIQVIFALETTPGAYNTQPYGYFATTPSIYAIPPVTDPVYFPQWVADQTAWMTTVIQRYPLAYFEIWNEWSTASGYWRENNVLANKPTVSAYATLFKSVYSAAKAAVPSCTIAVGGLVHLVHWSGANATTGVNVVPLLVGTSGFQCDAWSIHPYASDGGSQDPTAAGSASVNVFNDIGTFQATMIANGQGSKPLWVTEWGNWSAAAVGGESVKAAYLTASLRLIRNTYGLGKVGAGNAGVTIATFYTLQDQTSAPVDTGLYGTTADSHVGVTTQLASGAAFQAFTSSL